MNNKFVSFLLSLLIAFALWAYVVTVQAPESESTYYNVPVVLDGQDLLEARDLMIISQKGFTVNLTLSGYRTDLNKLDSSNITVLADLSKITTPGTHTLNYQVFYPGSVQSGNIHTVNQQPQSITLTVVEHSTKDIRVEVNCSGSVPAGYTADRQNVIVDHNTVTISGPKDVIDRIEQARVEIDVSGQSNTITQTLPYTLCDKNGNPVSGTENVTANVRDIQATVKILKLKSVPLKLHVIPGGGITEDMITITMERDSILLSGSESALDGLEEIVLGTIDLGKLTEDWESNMPVTLPSGVNNVTGVPAIHVSVKMPVLETREFQVGQEHFEIKGTPAGMDVNLQTETLVLKIRGPVMLLDELQQHTDRIRVHIDLTDGQEGSGSYVATIQILDMEAVGAVESYEVIVELVAQQAQEQPEA